MYLLAWVSPAAAIATLATFVGRDRTVPAKALTANAALSPVESKPHPRIRRELLPATPIRSPDSIAEIYHIVQGFIHDVSVSSGEACKTGVGLEISLCASSATSDSIVDG